MFCESYREALSEAVLRGGELPREAQEHVAGCGKCRRAWAEERVLLGMIDGGLQEMVNAEVPPSLVAGVRARVAQGLPARAWSWSKWAYGAAAVMLAVTVLLLAVGKREVRKEDANAVLTQGGSQVAANGANERGESVAGVEPNAERVPERVVKGKRERPANETGGSVEREVLVSGEEAAGLDQYLARLKNRQMSETVVRELVAVNHEPAFEIKPLEIEEIGWPQLAIEPLESGGSR